MKLPDTKGYQLISLDIFDTILLRGVAKPIDLFGLVWKEAEKIGITKTSMSLQEFQKLRIEMERRARLNVPNREVTLEDIYGQFPEFVAHDLSKLQELEIDYERKYCYWNPVFTDWMKEAAENGCILVCVSDMYLSSKVLRDLLQTSHENTGMIREIIVSNEYGCNKQNGELFEVLKQRYPEIPTEKMLHIGDQKNADYEQPMKRGLHAFWYDSVPDKMYSIFDSIYQVDSDRIAISLFLEAS